jgi:hypothetical protein
LLSGQTVQKWFSDALKIGDVKPSLTACKKFAREFQIIVNRQNNAELESCGSVPLDALGDVSPEDYLNRKVQKVVSTANQVLVAACDLEAFAGNYHWTDSSGSLEEIVTMLHRIGAFLQLAENDFAHALFSFGTGKPCAASQELCHKIVPRGVWLGGTLGNGLMMQFFLSANASARTGPARVPTRG